jgi:hypothetical protein
MMSEFVNGVFRIALTVGLITSLSCGQASRSESEKKLEQKTKQVEEFAAKRQAREKELASMNITQLAQEVRKDSERGAEPFNSMSYKQLVSRGEQAAPELKNQVKEGTRSSFLTLLALRQISATQYREVDAVLRVNVLLDALKNAKYFNSWGLPHQYWEEAAKAIIAEGQAAQKPLMGLLADKRPAPMWGSEEVVESQRYGYRVCDYAWALLKAIRGEKVEVPTDPKERDRMIAELAKQG